MFKSVLYTIWTFKIYKVERILSVTYFFFFKKIWSILVLLSPLWPTLVLFNLFRSTSIHLFHFGLFGLTLIHYSLFRSIWIPFNLFRSLWIPFGAINAVCRWSLLIFLLMSWHALFFVHGQKFTDTIRCVQEFKVKN